MLKDNQLSIVKSTYNERRTIFCRNIFFKTNEEVIVSVDDEHLILKRPPLNYQGKTYKVDKQSGYKLDIKADISFDVPLGHYNITEATEDILIVEFKDKVK